MLPHSHIMDEFNRLSDPALDEWENNRKGTEFQ